MWSFFELGQMMVLALFARNSRLSSKKTIRAYCIMFGMFFSEFAVFSGIDTRALTMKLREAGTVLGKVSTSSDQIKQP